MDENDVYVDMEIILKHMSLKKSRKYMFSLMGFCDKKLNKRREKVKKKFQLDYNKGYDDC